MFRVVKLYKLRIHLCGEFIARDTPLLCIYHLLHQSEAVPVWHGDPFPFAADEFRFWLNSFTIVSKGVCYGFARKS